MTHHGRVRRDLPSGTVTFLFTDVEGSTKLLHELGPAAYGTMLMEHRAIMRAAFSRHGGVEVDTQGDAFFVVFPQATAAVAAAREVRDKLAEGPIRLRMGLHTGAPHRTPDGYVGVDVHLGARIANAGHGGQVLLSPTTRASVEDDITELGEHRLKDFAEPTPIFQLGSERFPPLRTISNTNLPRPASSFVGREREVAQIVALVRGGARLVSLSGPGGTGKTRLAIEAGSELVGAFKAGVFWVDLSGIRDPTLVIETISQSLGAKGALAMHVAEREMLLVLDNFEQVIGAAPSLSQLLEACPNLQLVVTSRELLRARGEVEYAVQPLAEREAITLFCQRANAPADSTVDEICRRLDHLPLAIELAAARAKVLTPAQIAKRLEQRLPLLTSGARDLPERQRTLRGAIAWSYELLTSEEQRLLARLAVFRGGWTLEAAEAITDADLDVLQSLVEKSLVRRDGDRYSMLETIAEYARERLDASGEPASLHLRHAEFFLALAEEHEGRTLSGDPRDALDALERDHDNLRAAIESFGGAGDVQSAMRTAASLYEFWCMRGHATEGLRRIEELLASDERPTLARGKALVASSHLGPKAGRDRATQSARTQEALELNRSLGRGRAVVEAQYSLGIERLEGGDVQGAIALLEESIAGFRAIGEENLELAAMRSLAWAHEHLGDYAKYAEIIEGVLRLAKERGAKRMHFTALGALGWVATREGRYRDALVLLKEAYGIDRETLPRSDTGLLLTRLALAHAEWNRLETAAALLARSEVVNQETGDVDPDWVREWKDRVRSLVASGLDESAAAAAAARGRAMSIEDAAAVGFAPLSERAC